MKNIMYNILKGTFLVSDGAQYITGETIHVNGGLYMG